MLSVEKKKIQVELSFVKNLVQFSLRRPLFTQSRSSTESRHVPSSSSRSFVLFHHLLRHHISSPSSGPLVFQFQAGRLLLRPSGICSPAHSFIFRLNVQQRCQADKHLCSLLHVRSFFSSRTSFHGSLLFFYFEVEFPHLCLSLSLQWLDANPSLTFSSFSTSYAPRL